VEKFWVALKFAINVYVISTFIVLVVLGFVNLLNKVLQKKEE
jgi:hypothetical protein